MTIAAVLSEQVLLSFLDLLIQILIGKISDYNYNELVTLF